MTAGTIKAGDMIIGRRGVGGELSASAPCDLKWDAARGVWIASDGRRFRIVTTASELSFEELAPPTIFQASAVLVLERLLGPTLAKSVRLRHVAAREDPGFGPVIVFEVEGDNLPPGECSLILRVVDTIDGRATLPPIFQQKETTP